MEDKKSQNCGFEFSGEKPSQASQSENSEQHSGFQFESTSTNASSSENPHPKNESKAQSNRSNFMEQKLPNSGGILAMGIISIVSFCCCWGISGIVLGIIAIVMASNAERTYRENPDLFSLSSYKNMRAGKTTAIIGLIISIIWAIAQTLIITSGLDIIDLNESMQELNEIFQDPGY